jgi:serine/threonine protein kinase
MSLIGKKIKDYYVINVMKHNKIGNTYICTDKFNNKYSLKVINIDIYNKFGLNIKNVNDEIDALKILSGYIGNNNYELRQGVQYVVKYKDDFDMIIDDVNYKFIVMEYIDGINLEDYIKYKNISKNIYKIIYQLIEGLLHIHNMNYAHRDITPNNVIITKNGDVKYINYGFACRKICNIASCNDNCTKTQSTLKYLPPEVITGKYNENIDSAKAWDIWQLSLTIFNLCNHHKFPYVVINNAHKIKANIIKAPYINSSYIYDDRINVFVNNIIVNNWKNRSNINSIIDYFKSLFSEYFINNVNNNINNNNVNNNNVNNNNVNNNKNNNVNNNNVNNNNINNNNVNNNVNKNNVNNNNINNNNVNNNNVNNNNINNNNVNNNNVNNNNVNNNNVNNNNVNNNNVNNNNVNSSVKNNYELIKELGRGSFGITYLAIDSNGTKYAIKTINFRKNISKKELDFEVETLKTLSQNNNKYVVKYYESFLTKVNNNDNFCIVMEYIDGSSLGDFIKQNTNNNNTVLLDKNYIKNIFNQLIQGLKYIHSMNYAHRDIKPENIMITKNGDIKYIDYGLACLQKCKMQVCTDTCNNYGGTPLYEPPELFLNLYNGKIDMAKAWDVWSLTLTMFNLCNGISNFPYVYPNNIQQLKINIIKAPYIKSNYQLDDGQINQFLDSIIVNDWKHRPTIEQLESLYKNLDNKINN